MKLRSKLYLSFGVNSGNQRANPVPGSILENVRIRELALNKMQQEGITQGSIIELPNGDSFYSEPIVSSNNEALPVPIGDLSRVVHLSPDIEPTELLPNAQDARHFLTSDIKEYTVVTTESNRHLIGYSLTRPMESKPECPAAVVQVADLTGKIEDHETRRDDLEARILKQHVTNLKPELLAQALDEKLRTNTSKVLEEAAKNNGINYGHFRITGLDHVNGFVTSEPMEGQAGSLVQVNQTHSPIPQPENLGSLPADEIERIKLHAAKSREIQRRTNKLEKIVPVRPGLVEEALFKKHNYDPQKDLSFYKQENR